MAYISDPGNYMSFGLSGESDRSVMLGADAVVGWLDQSTGRGHVTDYYLERKSVCKGNTGSCPDVQWKEGTNNVRMLSAASVNGFTILTFQRKLGAADIYDKAILTNGSQPVIWAVGPIKDGLAHYHFLRNKDDLYIDFGRSPRWECPEPEAEPETSQNSPSPATILLQSTQTAAASSAQNTAGGGGGGAVTVSSQSFTTTTTSPYPSTSSITTTTTTAPTSTEKESVTTQSTASPVPELSGSSAPSQEYKAPVTAPSPTSWAVPPIPCYEPDDRVYYAQLGPTGGAYGYRTITGRQDKPQEAWYINGLLLPEIFLVRSLNYTFVIQGGDNSDIPSDYNPFYITDDPEGGHESKSLIERQGVKVYAGLQLDSRGRNIPTAVGKLCRWIENGNQPADFFTSYAAYQRSLFLNCDKGHSGILHFTPNQDTPDLLYYQSYTKRHLGWKIHVVDDCQVPSESKVHLVQHQQEQHRETPVDAPQLQTTSKSENLGIAIQQQQQQQLSQMSFPQLQLQLHPQTQQQQGSILHLSEQSGATDQRPGESANHQSVVAPFVPIGDSKTILNNPHAVSSISPIPGLGSGRPIENAYLFAASSPTGVPTLTLPNSVMKSPHHHHQQHQPQQQQQFQQQHQQQQIPSIISLDPNRLLINAKPVENGAVPQYASLQGHTVVSMSGQPDTFQFPHNSPFFQLAAMDGGNGATGNRIQNPAAFAPSTYQMSPLSDGHLMRRAGPPPPPSAPQALTSGPLNQFKFSKVGDRSELMYESRPEYFVGTNRAPLLSHPIRYDGIPMHSIMYASTASPISRVNNPISFITHGEKNPGEFAEFPSGAGVPGQNAIQVRFQDSRLRSQAEIAGMGNSDNMKYLELPSAPHNMHIMHPDGSASRIAPSGGAGAPPQVPAWAQSRNLPKREQRHPFFSEPTVHFNRDRIRTSLKSHGRDVRANDNLYEIGKMDERNNSPLQFSTQRSGPKTQGALQRLEEDTPSRAEKGSDSSNHAEGLLNTNSQPKQQQHNCNATENLSSSCRHDSNLEPSQQLPSPQQTEKDPRPPSSTTLSQPSGSGAREEVGGVGAVPVSSLPKMSKPSRQEDRKDVHVNGDEDEVKGQNEDKEQDEGVPKVGRKDGDGEEEGSAPDPLSLTLLTDIWQTINQDNGSKTPSQKPPAVPPPPPPPAPPSRRQIQRGMVASGGRNRPQLVFPIRRQPPPPISPGLHFGQRAF
ncbi:unnamed protein product [Orchesella dallaii]|uniref:DOMON domain-containing protein n=1 Tax=Orchesella dallaii TaxID=48710 RepID=A0ABP1PNB7_9HEXA